MTTREKLKQDEKSGVGLHMDEVSEQTRTFAAWWIHHLERTVRSHGLTWHVAHPIESVLGEVVVEWHPYSIHKTLSIYIEHETVTYLRHWDWDNQGRGGCMEEGECTWLDHGLLLWYWLTTSSSS
jgi:hypothetical protein